MADFTLSANTPLDGYRHNFDGIALEEEGDLAILSLAPAMGLERNFSSVVKNKLRLAVPEMGKASIGRNGLSHLLALQPQQYFLITQGYQPWPERALKQQVGETAYITDQSDSWAVLRIKGPRIHEVLERHFMLDLSSDAFPVGNAARTLMDHLGVMLYRLGEQDYWLFSAASSAGSFLHAVKTSCENLD